VKKKWCEKEAKNEGCELQALSIIAELWPTIFLPFLCFFTSHHVLISMS
jgi:hypothetical protein